MRGALGGRGSTPAGAVAHPDLPSSFSSQPSSLSHHGPQPFQSKQGLTYLPTCLVFAGVIDLVPKTPLVLFPPPLPWDPSPGPLPFLQPLGRELCASSCMVPSTGELLFMLQDPAEMFLPLGSPDLFPRKNHGSPSVPLQHNLLLSMSVGFDPTHWKLPWTGTGSQAESTCSLGKLRRETPQPFLIPTFLVTPGLSHPRKQL